MLTEMLLHFVVFLMLLVAAFLIILSSLRNIDIWNMNYHNYIVLTLVGDALLLLVIKEIIWTVLRFFKKEKFTLSPLIYVGVISGIREILFLSIENSIEKTDSLTVTLEILLNAVVVFLLVTSYYIFKKARTNAGEES